MGGGESSSSGGGGTAQTLGQALAKIRKGAAARWDKDELLDVIYWFRQVVGVAFGVAWGASGAVGLPALLLFFALNMLLTATLYKTVLGIDEEDYGGHAELVTEGLPGSFSSFMIAWVLSYTVTVGG